METYIIEFILQVYVSWDTGKDRFFIGTRKIFIENLSNICKYYLIEQGSTPNAFPTSKGVGVILRGG